MKFKLAPDTVPHVLELAILTAVGAGLTVLVTNLTSLNLGGWAPLVSASITIALSVITNLENN
jgi:hypothetical protein